MEYDSWMAKVSRIFQVGAVFLFAVLVLAVVWITFDSFHSYVWAVGKHWVALMSGLVSVAFTFYERVRRSVSRYWFYFVACLCLFLAGYQAWDEQERAFTSEHDKNGLLSAENDALRKPLFWVDALGQACIHYGQDGTYLFIPVSIENQGADSDGYVEPWVEYHSPTLDAKFSVFNISVNPTECAFHTQGGDKALVIKNSETIIARAHRGIQRFHHVEGRLPVKLVGAFGVQRQELESQQVQIRFCVRDGNGIKKCTTFKGPYQINGGEIATLNDDEVRSVGPQKY
jgi:hypothetical protein